MVDDNDSLCTIAGDNILISLSFYDFYRNPQFAYGIINLGKRGNKNDYNFQRNEKDF